MHLHAGHVTLALYPGSTPMSDTFSEAHSPSIPLQSSSSTACGCVLKNSSPSARGRTQTSQQATDKQARSHTSKDTVMLFHARASFSRNYRIAGNFRENKFSRITNKHARKKISRFLFSRQGHDIRPHPLQFPAWKW